MSSPALLLAACGAAPTKPPSHGPAAIVPAPADTSALTAPSDSGTVWTLSGTATAKAITLLDVTSGATDATVGVQPDATALAGSASTGLALSVGAGSVGALVLANGANGRTTNTVPLANPAIAVAMSENGARALVLEEGTNSWSVTVVDTASGTVLSTTAVPAHANAIVAGADGTSCWVLLPQGEVAQVQLSPSTSTTSPITEFATGQAAVALALDPSGQTMYVLRSGSKVANVAVVDLTTESVQRVLPAPRGAVGLAVAPDGRRLYIAATLSGQSNVQAFDL
jgi:DNA-binding beta-propeller fold protein YncE